MKVQFRCLRWGFRKEKVIETDNFEDTEELREFLDFIFKGQDYEFEAFDTGSEIIDSINFIFDEFIEVINSETPKKYLAYRSHVGNEYFSMQKADEYFICQTSEYKRHLEQQLLDMGTPESLMMYIDFEKYAFDSLVNEHFENEGYIFRRT